jgi:prepilin-type N-terminal cleavage/methylation domain-containing protein
MLKRVRGFTLVEVMISLAIFAIIASVLFAILIRNQQSARVTTSLVEAQQNARVAVDFLARNIRMAGYEVDLQNGQPVVQYAAPFEVMFNANIDPYPDTTDPRGNPEALDWTGTPIPPHSRRLGHPQDATGAETYVYTLDYNQDGVVDAADISATGDEQAAETHNPNDMMLMRRLYGFNPASGTDTVISEEIALVRGPLPAGQVVQPLFQYWLDTNNDGIADSLLGDANDDGVLSDAEIGTLKTLVWPVDSLALRAVGRVTITPIGEMQERDRSYRFNGGYRQVKIVSDVALSKNPSILSYFGTMDLRTIEGKVVRDCNEDQTGTTGLPGWTIKLGDAIVDVSDDEGHFSFVVAPNPYVLTIDMSGHPGWHLTGGSDTLRPDVSDSSDTTLRWYVNSAFGDAGGQIFVDVDLDSVLSPPDSSISAPLMGWYVFLWKQSNPTYRESTLVAPPESIWASSNSFIVQCSTYVCSLYTRSSMAEPNPWYARWQGRKRVFTASCVCDYVNILNIPLEKKSARPECEFGPMNTILIGGAPVWIKWNLQDPEGDTLTSNLDYTIDGSHYHTIRHNIVTPPSVTRDSVQWFVPYDIVENRLFINLTVDDPDPGNDQCLKHIGPLSIRAWQGVSGHTFVVLDNIPPLPVLQPTNMQRIYHVPLDTTGVEEDTAMVVTDTAGIYNIKVFAQQDTMRTKGHPEAATETGVVYADSARWISNVNVPPGGSVVAGVWKFYLWGNYASDSLCNIKFIVEVYCCANNGTGETLKFTTAGDTYDKIVKRVDLDFTEIFHSAPAIAACGRLLFKVKVQRLDTNGRTAKVYFYYNGRSASYATDSTQP